MYAKIQQTKNERYVKISEQLKQLLCSQTSTLSICTLDFLVVELDRNNVKLTP
jgi:hypothetical protein